MVRAATVSLVFVIAVTAGVIGTATAQPISEAFDAQGASSPNLDLTPAQRAEIYQAVMSRRIRDSDTAINPTIGAAVPRSADLSVLPSSAGMPTALEFATVADTVVVVDPVHMRVVDLIGGAVQR